MISINHLDKFVTTDRAKRKQLLYDITLNIPSGSVYALLGPNGAGKTTLIKCILGFMHTKKGDITTSVQHVGYAPDTTQLFPYLTGYEQMELVFDLHQSAETIPQNKLTKQIQTLMQKVGLDAQNTTHVRDYSAGMKKRLGLAMSLVNNPDLLIRDEPMAGVDPLGRITIKSLIHELKKAGKTLLFSTHILSDVEEVADTLAIIHHGRVLHEGPMDDISIPLESFFAQTVNNEKMSTTK